MFFVFFTGVPAAAQLQADFFPDKTGGCTALNVSFNNTTSGASSNAKYAWDFGNGNMSVEKNTAAVFYTEKTYTVTLTVTDGSKTSKKSKTITVFKKPIVDFRADAARGCLPFTVTFNSESAPGDGTLSSFYWDFGDGATQQSGSPQITHSYKFPQSASPTLTVSNGNGCTSSLTKKDLLTILPGIEVNFTAEKTSYCQVTDEVRFLNNSTGAGTLSYVWNFGDGTSSTEKLPSHVYNQKGVYTVALAVNSSTGCSASNTITLNIANFTSSLEPSTLLCVNNNITLLNTSNPSPVFSSWLIDGTAAYNSNGNDPVAPYFATTGAHTIQLTNNFGDCQQTITRQLDINPSLTVQGFIAEVTGACGSPVKVNFKDTTTGAVKWLWKFTSNTNSPTSELQSPSYIYPVDDLYTVMLTVSNAAGCSNTFSRTVFVSKPIVGVFSTDAAGNTACESITKSFTARSTEEIINYSWNFGDGITSTEKEPQHTYTQAGTYNVKLSYTTASGCQGTSLYAGNITVQRKIVADFTGPVTVCGNNPVTFNSISTGDINNIIWDYGDNVPGNGFYNTHSFAAEGNYTITFIAQNYGCSDTIVKKDFIHVVPPFPKIAGFSNTCDGNRGTVTFTDGSAQTDIWKWNFGDGTTISYTTAMAEIKHDYTKSGVYKAILTNTYGGCTVNDSVSVYVLMKQQPLLTSSNPVACVNSSLSLQVANLELPKVPFPLNQPNNYPYTYSIQQPDGSPFNAYVSGNNAVLPWSATLTTFTAGSQDVRVITASNPYFGCPDTSNTIPLVIKGPVPGIEIVTNNACFKIPVVFQDRSQPGNNTSIVKWEWNFGDGTIETKTQGTAVSHLYREPGNYYVTLSITDAEGCTSGSDSYANVVGVNGPKAAFTTSGNTVPLNTTVSFYNNTNSFNSNNTQYQWDFGDGSVSTDFSPNHLYTLSGTYKIQLIAVNTATQCGDTVTQSITVKKFNSAFSMSAVYIGNNGHCAPALMTFTNTSSNYTRIIWDFGDGVILENQNQPSHIYIDPGTYIVSLMVYGPNGLTGTYKDTIKISSPAAAIYTSITEGCTGLPVTLNAPVHNNTSLYFWDFGDGHVIRTSDSSAGHIYTSPGTYHPSLLSVDDNGCSSSVPLADKIMIRPDPVVRVTPDNAVLCKGRSIQLTASGAVSYLWSPADGLDDPETNSPMASPANTSTYTVIATDDKGCTGVGSVIVTVAQPFALQAGPDAVVCEGSNLQLHASGADSYQWINETTGLSNLQIANPDATPAVTTNYTVVGSDQHHCFTDTASVRVTVNPLPTINAGPDIETIIGSEVRLNPVAGSDVISWSWSPADYLSCNDCAFPVSKPRSPVDYTITVYNQYNCQAKDNVKINVVCAGGQIYIPAAFSPNNDGRNDRFVVLGNGVHIIQSLRIYNRWGEMVFERKNFYPDDINAAWDGNYKGLSAPAGIYIYVAEMECNARETFTRKGTLTLIR